ncbi:hypothetical protein [Saccharothrix sp. ST-888]|uniref:hypothetical protein n=1 Tax=Saccharothrix sp. ST-888 TaxID=1427391 RepID=UPI0006960250|nr:hypothetical protein [Saccharothrix sp. ST-888]
MGPEDWSNPRADRIAQRVLDHTRTGAIVLNHDGVLSSDAVPEHEGLADRSQTVAALMSYLPRLLDAGYRYTTPDAHPGPPAARPSRAEAPGPGTA